VNDYLYPTQQHRNYNVVTRSGNLLAIIAKILLHRHPSERSLFYSEMGIKSHTLRNN